MHYQWANYLNNQPQWHARSDSLGSEPPQRVINLFKILWWGAFINMFLCMSITFINLRMVAINIHESIGGEYVLMNFFALMIIFSLFIGISLCVGMRSVLPSIIIELFNSGGVSIIYRIMKKKGKAKSPIKRS